MTSSRPLPVRLSPRPVRSLGRRIASSQAAADLRSYGFLPWGCALILLCALLVGLASGDWVVTWDGLVRISPADLAPVIGNCGDYCGSDAGLLQP